jgi:membrane complex biogenesis BtpA family protein
MSLWLRDLFGVDKPVIAMAHFPPLPGTPLYDDRLGVAGILEAVRMDVEKLVDGGVDGLLFCNEGDRPYALQAGFEGVAVMTRVIAELSPLSKPFGVDFLWDGGRAALAMALATGASFVRGVFTGVYDSDMGLWNTDASGLLRYRRDIGAQSVRLFFNVTPEFASPLGDRPVGLLAKSAVVSSLADAILVSGPRAGAEPAPALLRQAKEAVGANSPVLLNTGASAQNIAEFLKVADGVIVGSSLKVDGYTWNPVDAARVAGFMAQVRMAREADAG